MKYLVLGSTGMLGHQVFLSCQERNLEVYGTVRSRQKIPKIFENSADSFVELPDAKDIDNIESVITGVKPDVVVNCIGIVKQADLAKNYLESIKINSLLPHELNAICVKANSRLIHVSTDCVFDGKKGMYSEGDHSNATDLYGKSKHLGEVNYGNAVTIRTSIIGHELSQSTHGLVEWFLAQDGTVNGYTKAFFSGLTTKELSKVILDVIIPQNIETGLYQIASKKISKYDLLKIVAEVYGKDVDIEPYHDFHIDRSLDGNRFAKLTGYRTPSWAAQVSEMRKE